MSKDIDVVAFHTRQQKQAAISKRLADASEKLGVAGMALAAYQGDYLAGFFGLCIFLYSLILTWRIG
ncbi:MAG: hypothetical protein LBS65_09020 [Desulfovibrio sp.]|nr:hypothetical protein [Desulfovibrio sp.]